MTTPDGTSRPAGSRISAGLAIAVVTGVTLAAGGGAWAVSTADDKRVDAGCGSWLEHRAGLRWSLLEIEEAAERAGLSNVRQEVYRLDRVEHALDGWIAASPAIRDGLRGTTAHSGESRENNLVYFLGLVDLQVGVVSDAVRSGDGRRAAAELDEAAARFQIVDDICLQAARGD